MFNSFLTFFLLFCLSSVFCTTPSVIIVGAGPAGVAAATKLLEHGYKNLTVLEAENRVGGRIYSVFFGDAYIDLGAEWCHGEKGNIVYDMVKDFNILRPTEFDVQFYHSTKKNIDKEFGKDLTHLMESMYSFEGDKDLKKDATVGQYLGPKFNSTIHEKYLLNHEKLKVAIDAMNYFQHAVLGLCSASSWFDPSAESDYKMCDGDQNLNWNGLGYKTILDILTKKFPDVSQQLPFDEKVHLNKEVVEVVWNTTLTVTCSDGTVYQADHVIFTPSVGVLKEKHENIFRPALPPNKQAAIQQIGFGAVIKVFMHFEKKWWDSDFLGIQLIWSKQDEKRVSEEFPTGPIKGGRSWLADLYEILLAERNPNVLVAWFTGDKIPEIELLSDDTMINGIELILNKFVGHKFNITRPNSIIRTHWHHNPHFKGTWSYQTIGSRKSNANAVLSEPLLNSEGRPRVMFAGEASNLFHFSTVQGAIETGHREADRIINLYK